MNNKALYLGNFEKRTLEDSGIVEGRAIVFGEKADLGYCEEIIDPSALDDADLRDVRLCLNHDTGYVYARSRNNNENSTMQLTVREDGLWIRANLDIENSPQAQSLFSAIQRDDINQMSFMFSVEDDEWENLDTDKPLRIIRKLGRIYEVSVVTFPAYEATMISARGVSESLDSVREALDNARAERRMIEAHKQRIRILKER